MKILIGYEGMNGADPPVASLRGHISLSRFFLGCFSHIVATQARRSARLARIHDEQMARPNSPLG